MQPHGGVVICQLCRRNPVTQVAVVHEPGSGREIDRFHLCDECSRPMIEMGLMQVSPVPLPVREG